MSLEEIGFYTLSDERARSTTETSPMWRCELLVTDRCNFHCAYCRGLPADTCGDLPVPDALRTLALWQKDGLRNIRFSGGEPTLYAGLGTLIHAVRPTAKRIALSTNGSASHDLYDYLLWAGVDDVSVSLDACCASFADKMARCDTKFDRLCENIRFMASRVYTTVGVVLDDENYTELTRIIDFADSLGVTDIRVIPAAQHSKHLGSVLLPDRLLAKYPLLRYRVQNASRGVRGLKAGDSHRCHLVVDDSAVAGQLHFPCIIYLREHGRPIGVVGPNMRHERAVWSHVHDTHADPICCENCLDVCVAYNNRVAEFVRGRERT